MIRSQLHDLASVEIIVKQAIKFYDEGQLVECEELCRKILTHSQKHPKALNLLGIIFFQTGRQEIGFSYLQQAVSLEPDFVGARFNLAKALRLKGHLGDATAALLKTLALKPDHVMALNELGNIYKELGQLTDSIGCYNRIFEIDPDFADAYINMGIVLLTQGELDKAEIYFRRAMKLQNNSRTIVHSNLLLCLQYNPAVSDDQLYSEHIEWDKAHGQAWRSRIPNWCNIPSPDRIIRLGYVSADFGKHPIGYFLESVFPAHNRSQFKTFCYSCREVEDELTVKIRRNVDVWRSVHNISDEQLAEIISADQIDILIDLSGHTGKNRLALFAMKPAPIQVTWAGYVGTTGLSAIDYLLSDERQSPACSEMSCVETIVRLPDCYICYTPPDYSPEVGTLPVLRNGYVTFGCFNNLSKITPHVVELWSRLLIRLPESRLVIRTLSLGDLGVHKRYLDLFTKNGITSGRVILKPGLPHRELLDEYNSIDIALDPFPYSGGLTTLESLWMGVPVVTLGGSRFCSRHSVTHLTTVGLESLIAANQEDYMNITESLARDVNRLSSLRVNLRSQLAKSPLCDAIRFTENLESAFRDMWHNWCNQQSGIQDY